MGICCMAQETHTGALYQPRGVGWGERGAAKSLQSCPTLRPHRRQPNRLPHPWDSPGKNTGVGCHFLLQCMKVKSESEVAQSCSTLCDPMDGSTPGLPVHQLLLELTQTHVHQVGDAIQSPQPLSSPSPPAPSPSQHQSLFQGVSS